MNVAGHQEQNATLSSSLPLEIRRHVQRVEPKATAELSELEGKTAAGQEESLAERFRSVKPSSTV